MTEIAHFLVASESQGVMLSYYLAGVALALLFLRW